LAGALVRPAFAQEALSDEPPAAEITPDDPTVSDDPALPRFAIQVEASSALPALLLDAAQRSNVSATDVRTSARRTSAQMVRPPEVGRTPTALMDFAGLDTATLVHPDRLAEQVSQARASVEETAQRAEQARQTALLLERRLRRQAARAPSAPSDGSSASALASVSAAIARVAAAITMSDPSAPGHASDTESAAHTPVLQHHDTVASLWAEVGAAERAHAAATHRLAVLEELAEAQSEAHAALAERFLDTTSITDEIAEERERLTTETRRTTQLEEDAQRARDEAARARAEATTELEREAATEAERLSEELTVIALERRREENEQSNVTDAKEAFLVQRQEFGERLRALRQPDVSIEQREELADRFFLTVQSLRRQDRTDALADREELRAQRDTIERLERAARAARSALELLESSDDPALTPSLRSALLGARRGAIAVADARLELQRWRYDLLQRRWALARQKVLYYAQLSDQLIPLLSRDQRRAVFEWTSENLREERYNLRDRFVGLQVLTRDRIERTGEFVDSLLSLEGIASIFRVTGASFLGIALLVAITRFRVPLLERLVAWLQSFRAVRRRQRVLLKSAELLRDLARPVTVWFAITLVRKQFSADIPELELLKSLVQTIVLYVIVMRAATTLLVPRIERGKLGTDSAELGTFGIDVFDIAPDTATLIVRTLRVWLVYTIGTSFALALLSFLLGEGLTTFGLGRVVFFGQFALIYAIVWWWRAVIVENTLAITRQSDTELGDRLRRHQERPWVVLLLAFLALYVVGARAWELTRRHATELRTVRQVRNFLFRKKVERSQQEASSQHRGPASERAFPPEYLAAFDGSTPVDDDIYVARLPQRQRILDLFERWLQGGPSGTVITAEWGMGKSTFLDRVVANLPTDVPRHAIRPSHRVTTVEEVLALAAEALGVEEVLDEATVVHALMSGPRQVIVIEDCERLFLRRIRGFDGLDVFLRIISATNRNVFWLLTFDAYAWEFVHRVRNRRHHFQLVLPLPPLTDRETRELIEKRAARTDIVADFSRLLDVDDRENDAPGTRTAIVQTEDGFYRLLTELAAGNPRVMLHYWLASVVPSDTRRVWVRLCERPAPTCIDSLSTSQLFALTALAQHQSLTAEEIAETIAIEVEAVRLDLEQLSEGGLIRMNAAGAARLSTHYLRAVLTGLRNKNMLYQRRPGA
jgi:hypothetical protein